MNQLHPSPFDARKSALVHVLVGGAALVAGFVAVVVGVMVLA